MIMPMTVLNALLGDITGNVLIFLRCIFVNNIEVHQLHEYSHNQIRGRATKNEIQGLKYRTARLEEIAIWKMTWDIND